MKKYIFDIHYDMVIRGIEVMADSIGEAAQIAKDKAARLPMEAAECVEQDAQLTEDPQELSERELRRMENEKVRAAAKSWFDSYDDLHDNDQVKTLAAVAFGRDTIYWIADSDNPAKWESCLMKSINDGTHPRTAIFERYARMLARQEFDRRYKNTAKSPFAASVDGLSKEQKKQAVTEAVEVLCSRMEYYVEHDGEEDCKVWEPQMIVRYDFGTDEHGQDDYWNLFVYCHGPNDQDGRDCYELATAWQHVHYDADGRDIYDDYGTEFHESRADLLRTLFYKAAPQFDETDEEPTWQRIESVWVD